jgi:hypothetical protein
MGAKSKSGPVAYRQQDLVAYRRRAGRDCHSACVDASAAALLLGGLVSDKFRVFIFSRILERQFGALDGPLGDRTLPPTDHGRSLSEQLRW